MVITGFNAGTGLGLATATNWNSSTPATATAAINASTDQLDTATTSLRTEAYEHVEQPGGCEYPSRFHDQYDQHPANGF